MALAWFIDDPAPAYAIRVKEALEGSAQAIVPSIWHLEVANALVVAERRGILSTDDTDLSLTQIEQLLQATIESLNDFVSVRLARDAARASQLTAYDAVYLETAMRQKIPIATLDKGLRSAAARAGIPLFRGKP